MWDLNSQTRDQTRAPAVEAWSIHRWTSREVAPHILRARHWEGIRREHVGIKSLLEPRTEVIDYVFVQGSFPL